MKRIIFLIMGIIIFIVTHAFAADPRWEGSVKDANKSRHIESVTLPPLPDPPQKPPPSPESLSYEKEKMQKMLSILKESPTPLRTPDTILRVMILPYIDSSNTLHNYSYTFVKVEDGNWLIGEYLLKPQSSSKLVLHPIDSNMMAAETVKGENNKMSGKPPTKQEADKVEHHF